MNDNLSLTFAALADPTRRAMLARIADGGATVNELAKPFLKNMSLPAVTKHLKVLEKAGLIRKTKNAQYRNCTLETKPLADATDWIQQYREMWEDQFDRLGDFLTAELKVKTPPKRKAKSHGRKSK